MNRCKFCDKSTIKTTCSRACANALSMIHRMGVWCTTIDYCINCGNVFKTIPNNSKRLFCSKSCAAKINNTIAIKRPKKNSNAYCEYCNCKLVKNNLKYCNRQCAGNHRKIKAVESWILGEDGSSKNGNLRGACRRYLIEEANNQCTRCGWHEINPYINEVILTVDHIDGNWQNNHKENLVVLCYNCHTLTPTFGSLNVGNSRKDNNLQRPGNYGRSIISEYPKPD